MEPDALLDALLGHVQGLEVALFGPDGRCRLARGRRLDATEGPGATAAELFAADWEVPVAHAVTEAAAGHAARGEVTDPDGRILAFTATARPDEPGAALVTLQDVTVERDTRRRLQAAAERFHELFDHSPTGLVLLGPDFVPLRANAAVTALVGRTGERREFGRMFDLVDPRDVAQITAILGDLVGGRRASASYEHTLMRPDGGRPRVRSHVRRVQLGDGRPGLLIQVVDISSEQGLADELRRLTTDDPLTGLLNRHGLELELATVAPRAWSDAPMAILLADIDDFRAVTDAVGLAEADLVLRDVADVLRDVVRRSDLVARTGDDEFALVLADLSADEAGPVADGVLERFAARVAGRPALAGTELTLSIGIADITPQMTLERALAGASIAVYAAKRAGKGRWMVGL